MAAVPPGTISFKQQANPGGLYGPQFLTCGSCGCVVADEELQTHVAWHATAAWVQTTFTPQVPAGTK
jgi:hypothetical protein